MKGAARLQHHWSNVWPQFILLASSVVHVTHSRLTCQARAETLQGLGHLLSKCFSELCDTWSIAASASTCGSGCRRGKFAHSQHPPTQTLLRTLSCATPRRPHSHWRWFPIKTTVVVAWPTPLAGSELLRNCRPSANNAAQFTRCGGSNRCSCCGCCSCNAAGARSVSK